MIKKTICVVGATSKIAEECLRQWSEEYFLNLILIARDEQKLKRISNDIKIRNNNIKITNFIIDFNNLTAINKVMKYIDMSYKIDIAMIAQGVMENNAIYQSNSTKMRDLINLNIISVVAFAEPILNHMTNNNFGKLILVGSVAGDRGRKSNYIYGASKSFVQTYAEGLNHRFYNSPIRIFLVKPGPTLTPMTRNFDENYTIKFADPKFVAKEICNKINKKNFLIYTPKKWRYIMFVIRSLPSFIFNRLDI
jgi:decaprenylphospho-beta-D-erythro-pentofuranosid-2-ulose 2-reductase